MQYEDGTQMTPIGIDEVEDEISINSIAINVTDNWKSNSGFVYPEISFYGECKCIKNMGYVLDLEMKSL